MLSELYIKRNQEKLLNKWLRNEALINGREF